MLLSENKCMAEQLVHTLNIPLSDVMTALLGNEYSLMCINKVIGNSMQE